MSINPNETQLKQIGNSSGFRVSKRVTCLIGELEDTFKIDVNTEKGQIILTNIKKLEGKLNE